MDKEEKMAQITFKGNPVQTSGELPKVGEAAPDFLLTKTDLSVGDIGVFELNEAFAAVGIASADDLGISLDVVNPNGGAIALGHPIGMSGNRLALTLLHELRRRGGGIGAAALCGGGGQGDALIVRANG